MNDSYQNLNLSRLKACNQYWSEMQNTSQGKLCSKCSNIIYDFRKKSKAEIAIIHATTEGNVCGLYLKNQLRTTETLKKTSNKKYFLKPTFYGLLALLLNQETEAKPLNEKEKIETFYEINPYGSNSSISMRQGLTKQDSSFITGQVKIAEEEDTLSQPGINILIEGTKAGTTSDINGNYSLFIPNEIADGDSVTVIFNFIGYATKKVTIENSSQILNVIMTPDDMQIIEFYIYARPPLHKRIWFWIIKPFRK